MNCENSLKVVTGSRIVSPLTKVRKSNIPALSRKVLFLVYESSCCLAWGAIFDRRKDSGVVCVFSIFNAGGSVCVCEFFHQLCTIP